jgi:hypothetical protein
MHTMPIITGWNRAWIALFLVFCAANAQAQTPPPLPDAVPMALSQATLTQAVTVSVQEINELSISSDVILTINTSSAGLGPDPASDGSATFSLTTNGSNKKITGHLDTNFSPGITLRALLGAPTPGIATEQVLSETAVDLVTGFGRIAISDLSISYTATATINVPPNGPGENRTMTLTLMDN